MIVGRDAPTANPAIPAAKGRKAGHTCLIGPPVASSMDGIQSSSRSNMPKSIAPPQPPIWPVMKQKKKGPPSSMVRVDRDLGKAAVDLPAGLQQFLHRVDGHLEVRLGALVELDLDDPLDSACADHHRHSDVEIV